MLLSTFLLSFCFDHTVKTTWSWWRFFLKKEYRNLRGKKLNRRQNSLSTYQQCGRKVNYPWLSRIWEAGIIYHSFLHPEWHGILNWEVRNGLGLGLGTDGSVVKNLPADAKGAGSVSGWGKSHVGGNGNSIQYSCLENLTDRGARGLQSMGSQGVTHDWVIEHARTHTECMLQCSWHTCGHTCWHVPESLEIQSWDLVKRQWGSQDSIVMLFSDTEEITLLQRDLALLKLTDHAFPFH